MNVTKKQMTWVGAVAVGVTVLTFAGKALELWPTMGWMSQANHDKDIATIEEKHTVQQEAVLNAVNALSVKMDVGRDEWKCDEWEEELVELLKQQAVDHTVQRQVDIDQVREAMSKKDCTRFE